MKTIELSFILKIFYLSMALIVISFMAFYAKGITEEKKIFRKNPKTLFYLWIGFLIAIAVMFHVITAAKIPWVHWEINRSDIIHSKEILVNIKKHKFILPKMSIAIKNGDIVRFKVTSSDLTYGFGVFRESGAMEFQMQVMPNHSNEIIWIFKDNGKYSIRSSEYAGPETLKMYIKDAIIVRK